MAVGDEAKLGVNSYVAFTPETTFGTYAVTTTAAHTCEPLSFGFKTEITSQKLDAISRNRGFTKRVQLDKTVGGTLEQFLHPEESVFLLAAALGGGIVSTSLTSAADHSISTGDFDGSLASLSFNVRKGDTHTWRYIGGRANTVTFTGAIGEPIRVSYEFMFQDSSLTTADDISSSLSISSVLPFTYVQGVFRYAATEANAATTTSEEPIQGFELTVNNNLVADANARELGTDTIGVLPPTRREIEFKITQRFDTSTSYNRFTQATQGAAELFFSGESITSEYNYEMTFRMPKLFLNTPEPEVGGPGEILSSEITYDVLVDDPNTTTGRDLGITARNATVSY